MSALSDAPLSDAIPPAPPPDALPPAPPPGDLPAVHPTTGLGDVRRLRADRARQVADILRRQVLSGVYPPGGALPSEAVLGREFGVSRNTVRDALAALVAEGLVARLQGTGTVVVGEARYPHALSRLTGLAEELREHGTVVNEVRATGVVTAPPLIAARLGRAEVVYVERLRRLNGRALSLDLTYLVREVGEAVVADDLAGTDIFTLIERHAGQPLGGGSLTVEAVNADPHTAALLGVAPGAALLAAERVACLADGQPVDLEYIRIRGDRLLLSGPLLRSGPDTPPSTQE
jgi:GntR family transcriptional regulator